MSNDPHPIGHIAAGFPTIVRPARARPWLAAAVAALAVLAAVPAAAEEAGLEVFVQHGSNGHGDYDRTGLALAFAPVWSSRAEGWQATLRPAIELAHYRYPDHADDNLSQVGGLALLRVHMGQGRLRPYAELGLGLALFSGTRLGRKDIATHYQFSEHLGLGLAFGERWRMGWRMSHYSNADIKAPNHGLDVHQLVLSARF